MSLKKRINKLAGKQTALNDGTPITILSPVMTGASGDGSMWWDGRVVVLNEETDKEQTVQVEDIAEDINKPWWRR
jgi:hypothetical protein